MRISLVTRIEKYSSIKEVSVKVSDKRANVSCGIRLFAGSIRLF